MKYSLSLDYKRKKMCGNAFLPPLHLWGGRCPGGSCPSWQLSGWQL